MALRIIRKSTSQSHVEIIRGTATDSKASFSVLCYLQKQEQLEAFKRLIYESKEISEHAEIIFMKSTEVQEALRPHFEALPHNIKLMSAPEKASLSRCLRTLVQEAGTDICWYLPWAPAPEELNWLPEALSFLKSNPNHAAAGPILYHQEKLISAGQSMVLDMPTHQLNLNQNSYTVNAGKEKIWNIGKDIARTDWQSLKHGYAPVPALPLELLLFSRSTYLGLSWEDSNWAAEWVSQDICIGLHQQQYWVHLLPFYVQAPEPVLQDLLTNSVSMPDTFAQRWRPVFRETLFDTYPVLGLKETSEKSFQAQPPQETDPVASYFAALKVS
ncbi:hypothetical protein COW36_24130 [bacterium (Candidatus Blackallbacteria) CG17_big_fil_post_rev_8_21_14_2_50_48_46]|uniref:Glycosyltransferase 2-like domain-containing protein n=1 Tax=bacterium (Candidatus Blackallbacteria) CG17_big_fil_post_rev_8_21_14_2_50_48_46 TaxID=2014261 RepID=A0A2M7FXC2_9BACT|nr:MAG: hypothetical protein COW64_19070 [bacterium (Candidatus Blackallbacteria) CG18_big_fil_WC_8_21_14_2_50_49_26]PIW13759.1 MAG: hypothetical protein COW36_24130 [bacterium (Candidatus Blackallbacteria) CG17_big_fil_post_rev_8_21_14_2_50_48_46]PIW44985.1 MAG: hypothetical protein COW20_21760 [bacterium (Candidatus Blackallbacteria) CG13_big_fil_rev_8_21_14_2_50_49_14]